MVAVTVLAILVGMGVASAEPIDNPVYAQWAKFKAGSFVRYAQKSVAMNNETTSEVEYKLLEVTPEKVVVEMSTSMTVAGNKVNVPPTRMEHLAKVEIRGSLATTTVAGAGSGSSKQAVEEFVLGDKKLKCNVMETNVDQAGSKVTSKIWHSDDVPGSLVKSETKLEGPMSSVTSITLVDVKADR